MRAGNAPARTDYFRKVTDQWLFLLKGFTSPTEKTPQICLRFAWILPKP